MFLHSGLSGSKLLRLKDEEFSTNLIRSVGSILDKAIDIISKVSLFAFLWEGAAIIKLKDRHQFEVIRWIQKRTWL